MCDSETAEQLLFPSSLGASCRRIIEASRRKAASKSANPVSQTHFWKEKRKKKMCLLGKVKERRKGGKEPQRFQSSMVWQETSKVPLSRTESKKNEEKKMLGKKINETENFVFFGEKNCA